MKRVVHLLFLTAFFMQNIQAQNHPNGVDFVLNGVTYPDFTYAGIRRGLSGQVGIPNITGPVFTVSGNDKAAIDAAVASAAAAGGGVVYLPAGTYNLSDVITITADNIVIRGAGQTQTIVKLNGATGSNVGAFNFVAVGDGLTYQPTADAFRGAKTMTLPSNHAFVAGDLAYLEINTVPDVYLNKSRVQNSNGRFHRTVNVVKSVSGNTITFNQPLRLDYLLSKGIYVRKLTPIRRCGVENLRLETTTNLGGAVHGIRFYYGYECWTNNVYIYKPSSWSIRYEKSKYCEARNSTWEDAWNKGSGGQGYGGPIGSYDCLVENITMINMRHAPNLQDESNGNVFRNSTAVGSDMQFHAGFCTENLIENISNSQGSSTMSYSFWTNHIASTLSPGAGFRNVLWNCDLSWNGRGIWFGGFNNGWVFAYNRVRSGGNWTGNYSYLVQFADQIDGIKLIGNRFAIANNGGDGGVWFLPGWTSSSVDVGSGISYSPTLVNGDTLGSTTKNIEFINNEFYGVPSNKRWLLSHMNTGLNTALDQNNTWNSAYDPANPPSRPTPPVTSLYDWQLSQLSGNGIPTVTIANPQNNASIATNSTVTITANAYDNGTVTNVKFYLNNTLLATDNDGSNGWSTNYTFSTNGNYQLSAVATDNQGATGSSEIVNVVVAPPNTLPTVTLTAPSSNISLTEGITYTLQATANDADGSVTKVGFYNGNTLLGEDLTSPYTLNWTPVAGTYSIVAKATDDRGGVSTSSPARTVTVTSNVVFYENMWEGTTPVNNSSIATHEAANRFKNDNFTMTGTGLISNAEASNYTGASGSWNVNLSYASGGQYFQISDINTTGVGGLQLSFGIRKSTTTSNGSTFKVEVSSDGINWTALVIPALPTGTGTVGWHYVTPSGNIPAASNLRIRFTNLGSASVIFRLDDVKLIFGSGALSGTMVNSRSLPIQEADIATGTMQMEVFPNPAHAIIHVRTNGFIGQASLQMTNAKGGRVYQRKINSGAPATIDVSHLPKGVYVVSLSAAGETVQRKIVVQ